MVQDCVHMDQLLLCTYGSFAMSHRGTRGTNEQAFLIEYWIHKYEIPRGEKVTYPRTVVDHRPEKIDNPWRTRITAGGDRLEYDGKTMVNSVEGRTDRIFETQLSHHQIYPAREM